MSDELKKIIKQNETMISLLGRMAFKPEEVEKIITSRKQDKQSYINGYNACDGTKTITEIAAIIRVTRQNMGPILSQWEQLGIVYEVEKPSGTFYKNIFPI
ncbi:MAG: hypothetical protein ACFFCT_13865 [Candidatus Odinarchaeota archaeon]